MTATVTFIALIIVIKVKGKIMIATSDNVICHASSYFFYFLYIHSHFLYFFPPDLSTF